MSSRARHIIARAVAALPNQCDADATAWAAGVSTRRMPWFPQSPGCREDALHEGECLCRKLGPGMDAQGWLHDLGDGYVQGARAELEELLRRGERRD